MTVAQLATEHIGAARTGRSEIASAAEVKLPIGQTVELVDWTHPESHTRTVSGQTRHESRFAVRCANPDCERVRWLKRIDARKAEDEQRICYHCKQAAHGALGWKVTKARYGEKIAVKHVQAYRLENPSTLEQAVGLALDDLGIREYRREEMICTKAHGRRRRCHLLDFVVSVDGVDHMIDVRGEYVHSQPDKQYRDRLMERLLKRRHVPLLVLLESDIRAGRAEAMLADFLKLHAHVEGGVL
jgi:hypothetical protein